MRFDYYREAIERLDPNSRVHPGNALQLRYVAARAREGMVPSARRRRRGDAEKGRATGSPCSAGGPNSGAPV